MDIGILHPGQMGAAVAAQAVQNHFPVYWLPAGRSAASRERATQAGLRPLADLAEMTARCELILSVCPPQFAWDVAGLLGAYPGILLEANAISPALAHRIADAVPGTVLDGGIVGPPPLHPGTTRLLLSGPSDAAARVAEVFAGTALDVSIMDGPVGQASALKLAFASWNKISLVLAAQASAFAEAHGVLADLRALAPTLPDGARIASAAPRAWRWSPEMDQIADALTDVGMVPDVALGAARLLDRWTAHKDDPTVPPEQLFLDLRH